tara:strand:+ start:17553 stop:17867 length:315 start_codon:yes stop_codon:yes gene_type:complete
MNEGDKHKVCKRLYENTDLMLKDIAEIVSVSGETVRRWANRNGWQSEKRAADYAKQLARYNKPITDSPEGSWRKKFDKWPEDQRFDTPGRHIFSLDIAKERRLG